MNTVEYPGFSSIIFLHHVRSTQNPANSQSISLLQVLHFIITDEGFSELKCLIKLIVLRGFINNRRSSLLGCSAI